MKGVHVQILSADEAGMHEDIIEDGLTFAENALKKARYVSEKTGEWSFADDSGVCIESLGCAPGIFSARWARKRGSKETHAKGEDIVPHTLQVMKHVPKEKRGAWLETACAIVSPEGEHWIFGGRVDGNITEEPHGIINHKIPYDAIFEPVGYKKTFGEMTTDEKNSISHRGKAFVELKNFLLKTLPGDR